MDFWAKTTPENKPGLSVYDHMVNVGRVAQAIAEIAPELPEHFKLKMSLIGALAALHDLGKISPGFQQKCEQWLFENNLIDIARNGCWDTGTETDHGRVSHASIQEFLAQQNCPRSIAKYIAAALGGHHGRIKYLPNDRGIGPPLIAPIDDTRSGLDWSGLRLESARKIWQYFKVEGGFDALIGESPVIWWLAGLTSVADWIGSDERFFSAEKADKSRDASAIAKNAIDAIGFTRPPILQNLTFEEIFGFPANDMQEKTLSAIAGPGVYVIEAPMGMGKTEAALGAAYQLMASGKASGIYFALPTQATSNRIHLRMNEFLGRIAPTSGSSRLIHGNSWLLRNDIDECRASSSGGNDPKQDARAGRDWFASSKRALLAPFGVGTIDQALLGIVAAKHFFVRRFALAGKVVILDEVHSYDVYTGTLIDRLIETLEGLGCTVIILSATLTDKRRTQMLSGWDSPAEASSNAYPLISGRSENAAFEPIAATPPPSKIIKIEFVPGEQAIEDAVSVARKGGAVLWICDTVGAAQKQFKLIGNRVNADFKIGLLHSRMIYNHREAREAEWMARFGKDSSTRCGSILVSTQVVEQSVDLDADLLITELAPTDMLLQRLGRLWRHRRGKRPADHPRICILQEEKTLDELRELTPNAIVAALGSKAKVYAPYVLLRSLEVWRGRQEVIVPIDIRFLLDATYSNRDGEPDAWVKLHDDAYAQTLVYRERAFSRSNIWQAALDDREGVQTRLNELSTISLILCTEMRKNKVCFMDGTTVTANKDEFRYAIAQAVHRNLVKAPAHHFAGVPADTLFDQYLYEQHAIGIVDGSGIVAVKGLKGGIRLTYSAVLGLVIDKI